MARCERCRSRIADRGRRDRARARLGSGIEARIAAAAKAGTGLRLTREDVAGLVAADRDGRNAAFRRRLERSRNRGR